MFSVLITGVFLEVIKDGLALDRQRGRGLGWRQAPASLDLVGHRPPLAAPSLLGILAARDLAVTLGLTFGDGLPIAAGWPPVAPLPGHHRWRPLREPLLAGLCDFE